jgi:type IV pilus assembly protein PilA
MKKLALLTCFLAMGSACSSAAAPGASNVVTQKDKATAIQVEAALRNAATAEQTYFVENQTYTADLAALGQMGFNASDGVEVRVASADATGFCIDSVSAGDPLHIGSPDITLRPGACA